VNYCSFRSFSMGIEHRPQGRNTWRTSRFLSSPDLHRLISSLINFFVLSKAFGLPDSDPEHGYLQTSFLLWAGVWLFFMIERFLKIIMDAKQRNNQQNNPTQTNNSWPLVECKHSRPHPSQSIQQRLLTEKSNPKTAEQGNELCVGTEIERIYESQEQAIKASFGHQAVCFVCLFINLSNIILNV
jgi:hypothetical protein